MAQTSNSLLSPTKSVKSLSQYLTNESLQFETGKRIITAFV